MFRSILIPLDGSRLAEQALPLAAAIAEWHQASLSLVVVHPWGPAEDAPRPGTRADRELREEEGVYLNRLMQAVAAAYQVPVYETVLDGNSGPQLVKFALERRIDLVVASTHGHGPIGRLKVGAVAGHLAHGLGAAVLFVKPQVLPVPMTAYGGFGRIVVALDGSRRAEAAIRPATALASRQGAVIALVRVIPPGGPELEERRIEAAAYLESLVRRLPRDGQRIQAAVLVGSNAARAVLTYADAEAMELFALTTRERGAMARTFFGSTTDAAIHRSRVPVLVCHAVPDGVRPSVNPAASVQ